MRTLADRLQRLVGTGFRIERELPLGGMSRLYVARDLAVERDVVVKVLPPDLACTASTARFRREVELTAQLLHPNIVPVLSAGGADDVLYYVTPFVPGESLRELLAREGALPLAAVRRVLDDVLDALAYAHSRGVVHRDVKPGNILLAAGGRAMLADFGIASALSAADRTGSDIVPGTPAYMAPEHPSDVQADLWATCVVAHEMLTGARPAPGVSAAEVVRARARVVGRREARRAEALAAVVARGLAVEPSRRYADVEALRAAVAASGQRRIVTRRRLAGAAIVAVLALAGFAATRPAMEAARARERGREAEARFELDAAIGAYRAALTYQEDDSVSRLGLARALVWRGGNADLVEAARELKRGAPRDSSVASALIALAEGRFPEACRDFERLARRDSTDVQAWMGVAECRRRDVAVRESHASPTGFEFRTGYHGAATAYEHVLDAAPGASIVHDRLSLVLPIQTNRQRLGMRIAGIDTTSFVAYPELSGDTLAFVPRPAPTSIIPSRRQDALEANMQRLFRRQRDWVRVAPTNAGAHRALAVLLERMGVVAQTGADDVSALQMIQRARQLAPLDSGLGYTLVEVRQLLKAGELTLVQRRTDSLFASVQEPDAHEADLLAGMAALRGRLRLLTTLLEKASAAPKHKVRDASGHEIELSETLRTVRARLMARAALGVCDAGYQEATARIPELVAASTPDGTDRSTLTRILLARPRAMAIACDPDHTPILSMPADQLIPLQRAFRTGGRPALRAAMGNLATVRRPLRPGDVSADYALGESVLLLQAGDSAGALERLDIALDALPTASASLLEQVAQAGAVGQMMLLAARLANALGDARTARRWADSVLILWNGADPELAPALEEMRCIVEGRARCRVDQP